MELHHKLRRDPNWHPNACNICGQLGHQAAFCPNGTIDWRKIYGDEAFVLTKPVFTDDYNRIMKRAELDYATIERQAKEYAKTREQQLANGTLPAAEPAATAPAAAAVGGAPAGAAAVMPGAEGGAAGLATAAGGAAAAAPAAAAAVAVPAEAPMPEGWAAATDAQGRTYFWHTVTKKVQWERPTADTPTQ